MTRLLLVAIACFIPLAAGAQAPDWIWAKSAINTSADNAFSIAAHRSGSTYVTGQFDAPTITFGNTTLVSSGASDVFVVKYDAAGNVLWAKHAGGVGFDVGTAVATDSMGNCYITGAFEGTATFDTVSLSSNGGGDIFVAKYSPAGNVLWAKSAGSSSLDGGNSIVVDGSGNSYVTGFYEGNFSYGSTSLVCAGSDDIFLAKYDPSGNALWTKGIGGTGKDWCTDAAVDVAGNVYLTGHYNSAGLDFGGATITNTNQNDAFIASFTPAGSISWAKTSNGTGSEVALSIAVDQEKNSYITGYYSGAATFGTTTLPATNNSDDLFVARYDATGNPVWAKSAGGAGADMGYAIAADPDGNTYITGMFGSSSIMFGSTTLSNAGTAPNSDLFVTKYDRSGNVQWARGVGGAGFDVGNGIDLDGQGNCYVTGTYNAAVRFGSTTLAVTGGEDVFVAKLPAGSTGVATTRLPANFRLYPNPAGDQLHIVADVAMSDNHALEVVDATGRTMVKRTLNSKELVLDIHTWPAGMYGVRMDGTLATFVKL